jgi:hypothetical protein
MKKIISYFLRENYFYCSQIAMIVLIYIGVTRLSLLSILLALVLLMIQLVARGFNVRTSGPYGLISDNWFQRPMGIWWGGYGDFQNANKLLRLIPLVVIIILGVLISFYDKSN